MTAGLLWVGVGIFFLVLLAIGWYGWKKTGPGLEEFFLGGRTLGTFVLVMTMMASTMSAVGYVGAVGLDYTHGIAWHVYMTEHVLIAAIFFFLGSRMWVLGKRHGYLNLTDLLADRYQSSGLALILVVVLLAGVLPFLGAQLRGAGVSFEGLTKGAVSFGTGMFLLTAVITIYAFLGGLRSVVWTDVLQGILMVVGLYVAMFVIVDRAAGGFAPLMQKVAATQPKLLSNPGGTGAFTGSMLVATYLMWGLGGILRVDLAQRLYMGKSLASLKRMAVWFPIATLILGLPPYFIAMAGRVYYRPEQVTRPDLVFPMLLGDLAPPVLALLVLVGMLAAMMSTADSMLLSGTSLIMRDVYQRFINPNPSQAKITLYSRVAVVLFMLGSVLIVLYGPATIVGMLSTIAFPIWVQAFPILAGGLLWKRATKWGAFAALAVGETVMVTLSMNLWTLPGLLPGFWGLIFGSAAFVGVSLVTPPAEARIIDRFFSPFAAKGEQKAPETAA